MTTIVETPDEAWKRIHMECQEWETRQRHQAMVDDITELFTSMRKEFSKYDRYREEDWAEARDDEMGGLHGDDPDNQETPDYVMPWNRRAWSHESYTFDYGNFLGGLEYYANGDDDADDQCKRIFIRVPKYRCPPDWKERQMAWGEKHGYWAEWWDEGF